LFQYGGAALLRYYEGSHVKALQSLYPELKLDEHRFFDSENRLKGFIITLELLLRANANTEFRKNEKRKVLDEFAKSKNFNPLEAENWYSITNSHKTEILQNVCIFFMKG
jgi:hypothetical protein